MRVFQGLKMELFPSKVVGHFVYLESFTRDEIMKAKGLKSCIKQKDLASLLWLPVAPDQKYEVEDNEEFLVLEYVGPRRADHTFGLPEGAVVEVHKYRALFCKKEKGKL